MTLDAKLAEQIRAANVKMHDRDVDVYDRINAYVANSFAQKEFWKDIDYIIARVGDPAQIHVLDGGAGTGNLTLKFLARGCRVTAVDISSGMLARLEEKAKSAERLTTVHSDLDSFFASAKPEYDVLTFCSTLHHLPDYVATVRAGVRLLKPGGVFYNVFEPVKGLRPTGLAAAFDRLDNWLFDGLAYGRFKPSRVARGVYRRARRLAGLKNPPLPPALDKSDDDLAEYHAVQGGIDRTALVSALEDEGLTLLKNELYAVQRLYPFYWVAKHIFRSRNALRLIAQRRVET